MCRKDERERWKRAGRDVGKGTKREWGGWMGWEVLSILLERR